MTESSRGSVKIEPGRKRVRAYLNGELVADTVRPVLVWEWPYYPAYYLPAADVRAPGPGLDIPHPAAGKPEDRRASVLYNEKVDVYLGDVLQDRPKTHFS
jgi:hypothetical protein